MCLEHNNLSGVLKQEINCLWANEQNVMSCYQIFASPDDSLKVCGAEKLHLGQMTKVLQNLTAFLAHNILLMARMRTDV